MPIQKQVEMKKLVSPSSGKLLFLSDDKRFLQTADNNEKFPLHDNTPILLKDKKAIASYATGSQEMSDQYAEYGTVSLKTRIKKTLLKIINYDYRTAKSVAAHKKAFENLNDESLCLAIEEVHSYSS